MPLLSRSHPLGPDSKLYKHCPTPLSRARSFSRHLKQSPSLRLEQPLCWRFSSLCFLYLSRALRVRRSLNSIQVLQKNVYVPLLAYSGSARSNGVLNAGYFCFQAMHQCYSAIFMKRRVSLVIPVATTSSCSWTAAMHLHFCAFYRVSSIWNYGYYNLCDRRRSSEGCRFLEVFPAEIVARLSSGIPNSAFCSSLYRILCKSQQRYFFTLGFYQFLKKKNPDSMSSSGSKDDMQDVVGAALEQTKIQSYYSTEDPPSLPVMLVIKSYNVDLF